RCGTIPGIELTLWITRISASSAGNVIRASPDEAYGATERRVRGVLPISFDEANSTRLLTVAQGSASLLREQGPSRRRAVEIAVDGFVGRYARLFIDACRVEAEDRYRLANVLDALVDQLRLAQRRAIAETDRRRELREWD